MDKIIEINITTLELVSFIQEKVYEFKDLRNFQANEILSPQLAKEFQEKKNFITIFDCLIEHKRKKYPSLFRVQADGIYCIKFDELIDIVQNAKPIWDSFSPTICGVPLDFPGRTIQNLERETSDKSKAKALLKWGSFTLGGYKVIILDSLDQDSVHFYKNRSRHESYLGEKTCIVNLAGDYHE